MLSCLQEVQHWLLGFSRALQQTTISSPTGKSPKLPKVGISRTDCHMCSGHQDTLQATAARTVPVTAISLPCPRVSFYNTHSLKAHMSTDIT